MELVIVAIIAAVAVVAVVLAAVTLAQQSTEGWRKALETEQNVRRHMTARLTTVENRLMSHHWQDFANLQMVPDETAKTQWVQERENRSPHSYGATPEEMEESRFVASGADLEGEVFEGPTLG